MTTSRLRLLVVDDEPGVARFVARACAEHFEVTVVDCGAEAVEHLSQCGSGIDLVLCDLMMPGTNGADVYAEVARVRPELLHRFLVMTAGAFSPETAEFLSCVRPPILAKPFDLEQLRTALFDISRRPG